MQRNRASHNAYLEEQQAKKDKEAKDREERHTKAAWDDSDCRKACWNRSENLNKCLAICQANYRKLIAE